MRCNLTKLVRWTIIIIVAIVCTNVLIFLRSPQYIRESLDDELRLAEVHKNAVHTRHAITTPAHVRLNSTSMCSGLQMKEALEEGKFQPVNGRNMYLYSAYLDGNRIRVIAIRELNSNLDPLFCHLWFRLRDGDPLVVAPAQVENMPEDHGRRFTAAYVFCQIPSQFVNETPHSVSLVAGSRCSDEANVLLVRVPGRITSRFTVCVTPFNYRYSRAYELVEMLELNKLLGADKFVFYNHTTGPNVDRVLELYTLSGEVEVHPWHLPMKVDTWPPTGDPEIHYFAQLAALNDCLFRHRDQSQYLVYQDLDEFIIPRTHNTWGELIQERDQPNGTVSVFSFQCVFFRKEWPRPAANFETPAQAFKSVILTYTQRENAYLLHGIRSKHILNPRTSSLVGIHNMWQNNGRSDMVPPSVASLHHYRSWEKPDDPVSRVVDELAVNKYGSRLVKVLAEVWSKLEHVPMDINISTYGDYV